MRLELRIAYLAVPFIDLPISMSRLPSLAVEDNGVELIQRLRNRYDSRGIEV